MIAMLGVASVSLAQAPSRSRYEPPSSEPENLFVLGDRLYFSADDGIHGTELWFLRDLDATPELVKDITPGPDGTALSKFSNAGERLVFRVENGGVGEVWSSDGTAENTQKLVLPVSGRSANYYAPCFDIGERRILVFNGMLEDGDFWITDGTSEGTLPLGSLKSHPYAIRFTGFTSGRLGDRVLFRAAENGLIAGLFITDGTVAGTHEVTRVWEGPGEILGLGDKAVFHGVSSEAGGELWITHGTAESTRLLADLMPGVQGSAPSQFAAFGGRAYFAAQTPKFGRELWSTDGTPEGTVLVKDIFPGGGGSDPGTLTVADTGIYFIATTEGTGRELWFSGGTPESTRMLQDLNPGPGDSDPYAFRVFNHLMFFSANNPQIGEEMYIAGPDGVRMLDDLVPGGESAEPSSTVRYQNWIVFAAKHPLYGRELFKTSYNPSRIELLADINSDGGRNPSSSPQHLTATPDALLFVADDIEHGTELWATDGSATGTRLVRDIFPGPASSDPQDLTLLGDEVYFRADDGTHGVELWGSDGTLEGTRLISDLAIKSSSAPRELTPMGDLLFFIAYTPEYGEEVWIMRGVDLHAVEDILPGSGGSDPSGLTVWNGRLYFRAQGTTGGAELWTSDGTTSGTYMLRDIAPLPVDVGRAPAAVPFRDSLFFAHDDGSHGTELWRFQESSSRGTLIKDIARTFTFR